MISSSAILVLTIRHHFYGAVIYSTPWRAHGAFFAGPVLLALAAAWLINRSWPTRSIGKVSKWVFILLAGTVSFGMFGLYEGGYNHVLKDVLYYAGASSQTMLTLFPPPSYEMPNDFFFELTGVAQFFVGLWAGFHLVRLLRSRRVDPGTTGTPANLANALRSV
jgi:hypothetical protein